jgi:GDP-mannose 6-dehydrogenase
MDIAVFGLGQLGCASAAYLARAGHRIVGVDVNEEKVRLVNAGQSPISEPGLDAPLASAVAERRLTATTDGAAAVRGSHAAIVCVDARRTRHGRPDLDAIGRVARQIGVWIPAGREPYTVILRRAVLPGTTARVLLPALLKAAAAGTRVRVAMHPQFLRQGAAVVDAHAPAVVVVGADDPGAAALVRSMYSGVRAPFVHTTLATAELVKYVCSASHGLAARLANDLADLALRMGVDGDQLMRIVALARRENVASAGLPPLASI